VLLTKETSWLTQLLFGYRFCWFVKCRQGLGKFGNEYGPLQEIPDWSYAGKCLDILKLLNIGIFVHWLHK